MSYDLVNGKLVPTAPDGRLDAPTPSQIAERAYDLATRIVVEYMDKHHDGENNECGTTSAGVEGELDKAKAAVLAALRESVINPGVVPWWRNR